MNTVIRLLCFLVDEYLLATRRLSCNRHGHVLIRMNPGAVCKLCGIWLDD